MHDGSPESSQTEAEAWVEQTLQRRIHGTPKLVQELWSGYGRIERIALAGGPPATVILKAVEPPRGGTRAHPRGWASERSHARKLRSYAVEHAFYSDFAGDLDAAARVPHLLGATNGQGRSWMLLEDLDAAGFSGRRHRVRDEELHACLEWLARFHAAFFGKDPHGLWERGTYWHLATRPDELAALKDVALKAAAPGLDARLQAASWRTFVHGDAKLANFCFRGDTGPGVAAVDFQYVGGGVGVQDVAYFLGSCFGDDELEGRVQGDLDHYFAVLRERLPREVDGAAVEGEWRALWPFAWADFHRFLLGWSPGHWKLSRYSKRMVSDALRALGA